MRATFQRSTSVVQSTGEGAQLWLCTVLRSLQREMRAEPQYAQALGRYLPAAEAEAAAALWRCVQPLLQATLLTTTELDADALALLGAVRDTRRQLASLGVAVHMGVLPVFQNWLVQQTAHWQADAAETAAALAPLAPLLATLRDGCVRVEQAAATADSAELVSAMRGSLPRELSLVLVHLGDRLCAAAERPPASSRALVWSDVDERWELAEPPPPEGGPQGGGAHAAEAEEAAGATGRDAPHALARADSGFAYESGGEETEGGGGEAAPARRASSSDSISSDELTRGLPLSARAGVAEEGARAEEALRGACMRMLRLADALASVGALTDRKSVV